MSKRRQSCADWSCGEPLKAQQLCIDFTPTEEDTDFIQEKCCSFWDFITNSPELQGLMVIPEVTYYNKPARTPSMCAESVSTVSSKTPETITYEKTALSVLELAAEKGLVADTFVPRLPTSCSLRDREYHENEPTSAILTSRFECKCGCCKQSDEKAKSSPSEPETQRLNNIMQLWDQNHPKSMEPPGRTPLMSHCVKKRNVKNKTCIT